jgi:hypothetical protein
MEDGKADPGFSTRKNQALLLETDGTKMGK